MQIVRRVFVSMPADRWLTNNQNELKWAIVEKVEELGFTTEIFSNPKFKPGLASNKSWRPDLASSILSKCAGAVIIGLPRWEFSYENQVIKLPTEFAHYEGALAHSLGIPMLVLVQNDLMRRTIFDYDFGQNIGEFSLEADKNWVLTEDFLNPFNYWKQEIVARKDLFIGYCGRSVETIKKLKELLDSNQIRYLDWLYHFTPADSILRQIEKASSLCSAAIFLFTADDDLVENTKAKAVPRDNVVFEAGYFINAKGKDRVLIIKEEGAKMPADLGGDIYASLKDRSSIENIKDVLARFISHL